MTERILAENELLKRKLEAIENDLVKWSRCHDPPEKEEQIHLWCSMNRLICDHFGTDWMPREGCISTEEEAEG